MRFYFDTEFIDASSRGRAEVHLVSIGVVTDSGAEFYAVASEYPHHLADAWFRENVIPHLGKDTTTPVTYQLMGTLLQEFIEGQLKDKVNIFGKPEKPEFWAYYADYDWVLLCALFGGMLSLPKGWPMLCMDLKQEAKGFGGPKLPQPEAEHNALSDAKSVREGYWYLHGK